MNLDVGDIEVISQCAMQLGIAQDALQGLLHALATILNDSAFVAQLLTINASIGTLSEDN